jgi:CelD/BcsL family acetyltransferase involved in cellulose biosynthesis
VSQGYTLEWISEWRDAERLAPEWEALVQRARRPSIFLTPQWLQPWWSVYGHNLQLAVLTARDETGRLVGLAPLASRSERRLGLKEVRCLALLGSFGVASDHLDVLVDAQREDDVAHAILSALFRATWDELVLADLAEDSVALRLLGRFARESGCQMRHRVGSVCPYVALPTSWREYLDTLSRNHREQWRSRERRLRETCGAIIRSLSSAEELGPALDDLMMLHERRWAGRGPLGRGAFFVPEFAAFHRDVSRRFLDRGWVELISLEVKGRPIAMQYNFDFRGTTHYYLSGFDPEWQRFSPGHVLMGRAMASAIARGRSEFDLLRGDEPYKTRWANGVRRTMTLEILRPGMESVLRDSQRRIQRRMVRGTGRLIPEALKQALRRYRIKRARGA